MTYKKKIYVAGHNGMVGSNLTKALQSSDVELVLRNKKELDLTNQKDVKSFFKKERIDEIYLVAAKVGGIYANNTYPAEFIYNNLMIETNIINAAYENEINKILFLGSSCIYPKESSQPIKENNLLKGYLEPTNEPYAIAKIAGIKLCESYNRQYGTSYRCIMSTNIYGPGDNYHPENSHVVPALIKKFHDAKSNNQSDVELWGSGEPRREFIYVEDLVDACTFIMNYPNEEYDENIHLMNSHINVGTGYDMKISELAMIISEIVGYTGNIQYNTNMPDGTMQKLLDVTLINNMGWRAKTSIKDGLKKTYQNYIEMI